MRAVDGPERRFEVALCQAHGPWLRPEVLEERHELAGAAVVDGSA